jgi:hypothetical protein
VQKIVNKSIEKGEIKQCHNFNEGQSDVEQLWKYISKKWENADGTTAQKAEHTYLKKDGKYYGLQLGLLDTAIVFSISDS